MTKVKKKISAKAYRPSFYLSLRKFSRTKQTKYLKKKEPKIVENPKSALFIKGKKTSQVILSVMNDLYLLKKPLALKLDRKNDVMPFEDTTFFEKFSRLRDASLFAFASHQKKRPHNLVLGRTFDAAVLDMIELGVTKYTPMSDFKVEKPDVGFKPMFCFIGSEFEHNPDFTLAKSMLLDFFHGETVSRIALMGLRHVICVTAVVPEIHFAVYRVSFKNSGTKIPRVELTECGPAIDFVVRRTRQASRDVMATATKTLGKRKKTKNVSRNAFGESIGMVYTNKQNMQTISLHTKRGKALRARKGEESVPEEEAPQAM